MSTTFTVDFFCTLDGYGTGKGWPGCWGKEGPEVREDRGADLRAGPGTRVVAERSGHPGGPGARPLRNRLSAGPLRAVRLFGPDEPGSGGDYPLSLFAV